MFIKYCKRKHNIALECKTIQLGTLEYYRDIEQTNKIADHQEGRQELVIGELDLTTQKGNRLKELSPLKGSLHLKNLRIRQSFPNTYIYCISSDPKKDYLTHATKFSNDYNSYFKIINIDEFSLRIASLIMENLKIENFHETISERIKDFSISDFGKLSINIRKKFVEYNEGKIDLIHESELVINKSDTDPLNRMVFTKDIWFKDDREYRIAFFIHHPKYGVLSVKKDPILLPINIFSRCCSAL